MSTLPLILSIVSFAIAAINISRGNHGLATFFFGTFLFILILDSSWQRN